MIKRTPLDAMVSDLVREAADWACERCGIEFPDRKSRNLHASHYFGRAIDSTRHFLDNVSSLCGGCHKELSSDHDEHYRFMMRRLGEVRYDLLRQRKQKVVRYRASDYKAMREHYRSELERLRAMRADGVQGHIEVVAYD